MSQRLKTSAFFYRLALTLVLLFAFSSTVLAQETIVRSTYAEEEKKAQEAKQEGTKWKVFGDLDVWLKGLDGTEFSNADNSEKDNFFTTQRVRVFVNAQPSDVLSLHFMARVKPDRWGDGGNQTALKNSGFNMDGDNNIWLTRMVYAKWKALPNTTIDAGLIPIALPIGASRNGVLDSSIGGISVKYNFSPDKAIIGSWGRAYDEGETSDTGRMHDDADFFVLMAPLQFNEPNLFIAPWAIYGRIGADSKYWQQRVPHVSTGPRDPNNGKLLTTSLSDNADAFWGGFATRWYLGNFGILGDFAYGKIKSEYGPASEGLNYNTEGWHVALRTEYKTHSAIGTPYMLAWYASGSDYDDVKDKQKWGVLPSISTFGDGFFPTKTGFDDGLISFLPSGKAGVVLGLEDMSFFSQKLIHTARVAYYEGTSDKDLARDANRRQHLANSTRDFIPMFKDDYFIELNLDNTYAATKDIDVKFNLGYINTNRSTAWGSERNIDDVYSAVLNVKFRF